MSNRNYTKKELEAIAYFSPNAIAERENQQDAERLEWYNGQGKLK